MVIATRDRALTLRVSGFPDLSLDSPDFASLQGTKGFGVPGRTNLWFDGAGDGSLWRGARTGRRAITLPVLVQGATPNDVEDRLSDLAERFAPERGLARLLLDEGSRGVWYCDVAYSGGIDPEYGKDTNGASWAQPTLLLEAGDPFWTRVEPVSVPIRAAGAGRGLLKGDVSLSQLRQASGQTMGTIQFDNPGNATAYPITTIYGPATGAVMTSGDLTYTWEGNLAEGERRVFVHRNGEVYDPDDTTGDPNRYAEMGTAPKFWTVPPGVSEASLILEGDVPGISQIVVAYQPRRWLVF